MPAPAEKLHRSELVESKSSVSTSIPAVSTLPPGKAGLMARASNLATNNAIAGVFAAAQPTPSTTNTWVSLHTADPGTTGASEYAGVTRIQFSVGSPSAGVVSNTGTMTFTTSGASSVPYIGSWDAVTTGNYRIGAALGTPVTAVSIVFAVGAIQFSAV